MISSELASTNKKYLTNFLQLISAKNIFYNIFKTCLIVAQKESTRINPDIPWTIRLN